MARYPALMPNPRRYRLSDMDLDFVSLVAAGDDPLANVVIAKAAPDGHKSAGDDPLASTLSGNDHPEDTVPEINKSDLDPEVVTYIETLESEVDTLGKQVAKSEQDIEALNETLSKSAPLDSEAAEKEMLEKADPALRSLIEKQQVAVKEAQEIAKAERDQRLDREFISKAADLPMLAEDTTSLGGLLRHAHEVLSKEDAEQLDTILKAANEAISSSSLFATFGTGGGETTVSKSVAAKTAEVLKSEPGLTKDQAEAKVYEQNPDLFAQAMTGQEG